MLRRSRAAALAACLTVGATAASTPPATSAERARSAPAAAGTLTLITEPQDGIAPVLSAVRGARHAVDMVMYEDDDPQVDAALAADVRRGVAVRVLLDGGYYGAGAPVNQAAYDSLRAGGVPVRWTPRSFALTHEKTLVIDGRAYILTFNLTPRSYASSRDFGVIDTNPADDAAVERTFDADWSARPITAPSGSDLVWSPGSQGAQVALIQSASGSLDVYNEEMASPAIEQALASDARRGVDVRVTMTADPSWERAFAALTAAGVHVRTFAADAALYIHAKMILTPRRAFLGSENFSTTSMDRNRELGLITADASVRASLARTFDADYAKAAPYAAAGTPGGGGMAPARCSVTVAYSSRYGDWDVYVRSNRPQATATVTDSSGATAGYRTDSSGYADIYLRAPASAAGERITVHVAQATCAGVL